MSHSAILVSRRSSIVLLAGMAVALGSPSAHGGKLRWKFKPGEKLHYQMEQKTSTTAKSDGQESKTTMTQTINTTWQVHSVAPDGSAEMSQTIERMRVKMETPFAKFEYDSADKKEPAAEKKPAESQLSAMLMPLLKAQVGAEFKYKINPMGELSDIRVPASLLSALNPAGGGGGMFSEDALKDMIRESSLTFPAADMQSGQTWSSKSKMAQGPAVTVSVEKTYTYQGQEGKTDKVAVTVKVTPEVAAGNQLAIKVNSQEGKGSFLFDAEKGCVVRSTVSKKLDATISREGKEFTQISDESNVMTLTDGQGGASK